MKNMLANRIARDGTSHLGLFCLPLSHKKDAGLMMGKLKYVPLENTPIKTILY